MALASPSLSLSPARFEVSERGEVAREGNIFSRCSDDYSHLTSPVCGFSCSSSFARPHCNVSISKFPFSFIHFGIRSDSASASSQTGSLFVAHTSIAIIFTISFGRIAKSPAELGVRRDEIRKRQIRRTALGIKH